MNENYVHEENCLGSHLVDEMGNYLVCGKSIAAMNKAMDEFIHSQEYKTLKASKKQDIPKEEI